MNSEKKQLYFILGVLVILAVTVVMFLLVGGEFNFLFIHFSASGILSGISWLIPLLLIAGQQLYVLPAFMKSYWEIFSETPPTAAETWVPMLNERVVFTSKGIATATYALWGIIAGAIILMISPVLTIFDTNLMDVMYYFGLFIATCFIIISIIRGYHYLAVRRDIYDLHNKYMGIRGTSVVSWVYRALYFIPLARSLSLLSDLQVMDKLTKFNDIEKMKTELYEEEK